MHATKQEIEQKRKQNRTKQLAPEMDKKRIVGAKTKAEQSSSGWSRNRGKTEVRSSWLERNQGQNKAGC